jgi:hypothetical protein
VRIFLSSIFLVLTTFSVNVSWGETILWHEGSIVLKSKQVLQGKLFVEQAYDVVLFKGDSQIMVYPSHKISALFYHDATNNINRKFICIQQKNGIVMGDHLFEIVLPGEIGVIRRIKSTLVDQRDDANAFNYFLKFGEELTEMHKFRNKIYPTITRITPTLPEFILQNKLNPNIPADIIQIIRYYNRERSKPEVMALNF